MKNPIIVLSAMLLLSGDGSAAHAGQRALTDDQKQAIAWAIKILIANDVVYQDANKCTRVEPSIIEQLLQEGLLDKSDSRLMSICVDANPGG